MDNSTSEAPKWRNSRSGFAIAWFLSLVACWLVLRAVLFFQFQPFISSGEALLAFGAGLLRDALAAAWLTLPLLFWWWCVPEKWFGALWHRWLFWFVCLAFWAVQVFLLFVEYFFFEEFKSRFNTVAVDYLEYPKEVFVNIQESYHVGLFILICLFLAAAWVALAGWLFRGMWGAAQPRFRFRRSLASAALGLFLLPLALIAASLTGVWSSPISLKGAHVSPDRTLNEVADNGSFSFLSAALTHNLDYHAFYKTMPMDAAYARARGLLAQTNAPFTEDGQSIRRHVAGDSTRPRLNVVVFLEESLGSEFWGCLGRPRTVTPEMDKLAASDGLLFTDVYACGNRTVRGMEGVLSSFPPLPGDSIVKRNHSDDVETIARILKRDGYSTHFLYGGRGVFDGMRSFALRNGYDRFIEQKHFPHPTFTTIWGVCDEDLYDRGLEEFRALAQTGQPFFATLLSVSNHKPYTYPAGRIPETARKQENAVKYADYALGRFFRQARQEPFWTNTIFVVVADHGARVYGSQSIPIHSYEIPLLIVGPAVVKEPARIPVPGSSLDVSPTILGLLGRPYDTMFFGHDLLGCPPEQTRSLLNHNRDIGMLARERLVVLGLMKTVEFYAGDPKKVNMELLSHPAASDAELESDVMAIFQVADDLYMHDRYRLDPK